MTITSQNSQDLMNKDEALSLIHEIKNDVNSIRQKLILLKTKPYIFLRYPQPSQHLYTNHPQPCCYSQKNQMLLYLLESCGLGVFD